MGSPYLEKEKLLLKYMRKSLYYIHQRIIIKLFRQNCFLGKNHLSFLDCPFSLLYI